MTAGRQQMRRFSTGNEYISIPDISASTGGIESAGFVHNGFRACVELRGAPDAPLLRPVVEIDGRELPNSHMHSDLLAYWIPRFTVPTPELAATSTIFAPLDRRGFICALELENLSSAEIKVRAGWRGCWQSSHIAAGLSRRISGAKYANISSRAPGAPVVEFRGNIPLFAMALPAPAGRQGSGMQQRRRVPDRAHAGRHQRRGRGAAFLRTDRGAHARAVREAVAGDLRRHRPGGTQRGGIGDGDAVTGLGADCWQT